MRRFAFFLSSEKYQNYPDTPYCHADAELLRDTLITNCDYLPENASILRLEKGDGVGADTIIATIAGLVERAEDGDSLLFFYAGHGVAVDSKTYLVLPDTSRFDVPNTSVKLSDITYYLSKNKRLNIRIFDCCHSGENSRNADVEFEIAAQDFMREVLAEGNDCSITLASCAATEKSYWDEVEGNGVFTASLVKAIKSYKGDENIYAEILKINVCDSVYQWCSARGKTQTPTLTAQVTGNMPIARRAKPKALEFFQDTMKSPSLSERLNNARSIKLVDEKFYPELDKAILTIAGEATKVFNPDDLFGINLKQMPARKSEDIPPFLKERILNRMKSYNTMHVMEVTREERPQLKSVLNSFLEHKPVFDTRYYISQKSEMPNSFLTFESETDGFLPSSGLFFYVCPLQASVAVVSGFYFDKSYNEAESRISVPMVQHCVYPLRDFEAEKYLLELNNLKQKYHFELGVRIDERLNILEKDTDSLH